MGSFDEKKRYIKRCIKLSFRCVCKYHNQSIRRRGENNGKSFKGVLKTKKEKENLKRLSFIPQFTIEFLLLFTSCRKVLGKMPAYCFYTNSQEKKKKFADYALNGVDLKAEKYLEPSRTSMINLFLQKLLKVLSINYFCKKTSIRDFRVGSNYTPVGRL